MKKFWKAAGLAALCIMLLVAFGAIAFVKPQPKRASADTFAGQAQEHNLTKTQLLNAANTFPLQKRKQQRKKRKNAAFYVCAIHKNAL